MKTLALCCVVSQFMFLLRHSYSQCGALFLPHGRVVSYQDGESEGTYTVAIYVCNEGFLPKVSTTTSCSGMSVWEPAETLCRIGKNTMSYHTT